MSTTEYEEIEIPDEMIGPDGSVNVSDLAEYARVVVAEQKRSIVWPYDLMMEPVKPAVYLNPVTELTQDRNFNLLFAQPGKGKTFLALDEFVRLAELGKRVLYLSYEGPDTLRERLQWRVRMTMPSDPDRQAARHEHLKQHLALAPWYDSRDSEGFAQDVCNAEDEVQMKRLLDEWDVIIVDTFMAMATRSSSFPITSENDSVEIRKALGVWAAFKEYTGKPVLMLHHAGKDETLGPRGSSEFSSVPDTIELLQGNIGGKWIRSEKKNRRAENKTRIGTMDWATYETTWKRAGQETSARQEGPDIRATIRNAFRDNETIRSMNKCYEITRGNREAVSKEWKDCLAAGLIVQAEGGYVWQGGAQ